MYGLLCPYKEKLEIAHLEWVISLDSCWSMNKYIVVVVRNTCTQFKCAFEFEQFRKWTYNFWTLKWCGSISTRNNNFTFCIYAHKYNIHEVLESQVQWCPYVIIIEQFT